MRITPLEIRQKSFEKKLRGYDKDEVQAFLQSLSTEWERIVDENKEMKIKLEQTQKEVEKLREVENSLFKTLKTAEDTGANLIDQANKAAELHLKETQMNAEAILGESKSKAKNIIEDAEQKAKEMISEMQDAIKDLEKNYKSIESQRDTIINELINLSNDVKDRVQRTTKQHKEFKLEDHLTRVRQLVRESEDQINKEKLTVKVTKSESIPSVNPQDENAQEKLEDYIKSRKKESESKPVQKTTSPPKRASIKSNEDQSEEELTGKGSFFDQVGD
jgi:cell division initiation protein